MHQSIKILQARARFMSVIASSCLLVIVSAHQQEQRQQQTSNEQANGDQIEHSDQLLRLTNSDDINALVSIQTI